MHAATQIKIAAERVDYNKHAGDNYVTHFYRLTA